MVIIKNIRICIKEIIWIFIVFLFGCNEKVFLEVENRGQISDVSLWANETNADLQLSYCYGLLPQFGNEPLQLEDFTDNSIITVYYTAWVWKQNNVTSEISSYSIWNGQCGPDFSINWEQTYNVIRRLNEFINKTDENSQNFSQGWLRRRTDEARFLRAFFYSELFMRQGGLVILTEPQDRNFQTDDELFLKRSSFEDTFNFLVQELSEIEGNGFLPEKYEKGDPNSGRATLGAALALKGWLQVFAASPAYNSSTPVITDDPDHLQSFAGFSAKRWEDAAATNKRFIELFGHKGNGRYNLFPTMKEFWWEENEYNVEVLWDRQHVSSLLPNTYNEYGGPLIVEGATVSWGNYNPTQQLVDKFQMANGKDINDPTSGYDPQNPFVGREKRLYDFIVFDGAVYYQEWMKGGPETIYTRIDKVNPSPNEVDFGFEDATHTGYFCKKRLDHLHSSSAEGGNNYIYYRYAEVLLNYAEAQNEAYGPDASVYDAINSIRSRPGTDLPELPFGLNKDQMREAIRHERRIELAFENKRLFDIWRWGILEDVLNEDPKGMKVYNSKPNDNSGQWIYEPFSLGDLGYPHQVGKRQYFVPMRTAVLEKNPKLKQNWGY